MIYNYYLDPEILSGEIGNNASALNVLALLRGIAENGFISIFEEQGFWIEDVDSDEEDDSDIVTAVNRISDPDTKRKIKSVLKHLMNHRRILDDLGKPEGSKDLLKAALLKSDALSIDVAISDRESKDVGDPVTDCILTNLNDYFISDTEEQRREYIAYGSFYFGGEETHEEFLSKNFGFLMRHAQTIEIYDGFLGKGTGNFEMSLKPFLAYLESVCKKAETCLVRLHVPNPVKGDGRIDNLKRWLVQGTKKIGIELKVYGDPSEENEFLHDRFLVIDDFAFIISRGFDFLDERTGKNKDISIHFKSKDKVMSCIRELSNTKDTIETTRLR